MYNRDIYKKVRRSREAETDMEKLRHRSYAKLRIKFVIFDIQGLVFSIGADAIFYLFFIFLINLAFMPIGSRKPVQNMSNIILTVFFVCNSRKYYHLTVLLIVTFSSHPRGVNIWKFMTLLLIWTMQGEGWHCTLCSLASKYCILHTLYSAYRWVSTLQHALVFTRMKQTWWRLELMTECLQHIRTELRLSQYSHGSGLSFPIASR